MAVAGFACGQIEDNWVENYEQVAIQLRFTRTPRRTLVKKKSHSEVEVKRRNPKGKHAPNADNYSRKIFLTKMSTMKDHQHEAKVKTQPLVSKFMQNIIVLVYLLLV